MGITTNKSFPRLVQSVHVRTTWYDIGDLEAAVDACSNFIDMAAGYNQIILGESGFCIFVVLNGILGFLYLE